MRKKHFPLLLLLLLYPLLILISAHFGPIDDHNFIKTLQLGKPLTPCITVETGRFFPLCAREYGLVARLAAAPFWYYMFNACQYLLLAVIIRALFIAIAAAELWPWALLFLSLTPGFVSGWFRMIVAERGALFFFVLALLAYLRHIQSRTVVSLLSAAVTASCALYYKEPAFLMLGTFAATRLAIGIRQQEKETRWLDLLLLVSCLIFVAIYYSVIYLHRGDHLYGAMPGNSLRLLANVIFGFALNDPFVVFVVIPLAGWRLFYLLVRKGGAEPVADPLLFGATVYALAFWQLKLFQPYYWLPVYGFALPALVIFWQQGVIFKVRCWRWALIFAAGLHLLNAVPQALHLLSFQVYNGRNFQQALVALDREIRSSPAGERTVFFLDGVNRASGVELYESLAIFLQSRGIGVDRFDLKSDLPADNPFLVAGENGKSPLTVFRDSAPAAILGGDYLLITPYALKRVDTDYRAALKRDYLTVFSTRSPLAIPSLGLFPLARYLVARMKGGGGANIMAWPDYYLYRRK